MQKLLEMLRLVNSIVTLKPYQMTPDSPRPRWKPIQGLRVTCPECGRSVRAWYLVGGSVYHTEQLYSRGCICRLETPLLCGLLNAEQDALAAYHAFRWAWFQKLGLPESIIRLHLEHYPPVQISYGMRGDILCILHWRQQQREEQDEELWQTLQRLPGLTVQQAYDFYHLKRSIGVPRTLEIVNSEFAQEPPQNRIREAA